MKRWMALVVGALLGSSVAFGAASDEPKKHLAEIDGYIADARDHVRVLYSTTELPAGRSDAPILKEEVANLERAITNADRHLTILRGMEEVKISDMGKIAELGRNLGEARGQLTSLKSAAKLEDRVQLRMGSAQIWATLKKADSTFDALASMTDYRRLNKVEPSEKQPVRGIDFEEELD